MNTTTLRAKYIEDLAKKYGWKAGAELGVLVGKTHFRLLENIPDLKMIAVDTWKDKSRSCNYAKQAENRNEFYERSALFGERSMVIEMDTVEAAKQVPDATLDFVFIDADHSYEGCKSDILAWLPKIKSEGWILGHDYFEFPGVKKAVDELLSPVNCPSKETDETWARPKMPTNSVTVCCLKKGDKYGPEYVNKLASMVMRNVHLVGYDFVCFTDDPTGIDTHIRTVPLPYDAPNWWGKMGLYMPSIPGLLTGRILFLDLDVVITGSLDDLLEYPSDFAMAKDWPAWAWPITDARESDGNSSVVLLKIGAASTIWDRYCREGKPMNGTYGDQEWINRTFHRLPELLPERFVKSYKLHNLAGETPPECSVVMFHGEPKPPDCSGWVKEMWR